MEECKAAYSLVVASVFWVMNVTGLMRILLVCFFPSLVEICSVSLCIGHKKAKCG